jgi:hypothetical protein
MAYVSHPNQIFPAENGSFPVNPATDVILTSKADEAQGMVPAHYALTKQQASAGSSLLAGLIESDGTPSELLRIDLDIDGFTLGLCVSYFVYHFNNEAPDIEKPLTRDLREFLTPWDRDFLYGTLILGNDEQQHGNLIAALRAAHYLNAKKLLELTGAGLASIMRGKTVEQVQHVFNIEQDQSPEDVEAIRQSNARYDRAIASA